MSIETRKQKPLVTGSHQGWLLFKVGLMETGDLQESRAVRRAGNKRQATEGQLMGKKN